MKIPLGKHIHTGQLKLISELDKDAERGLKCQCVCVGCGSQLVARMGEKRTHYFAHFRKENSSQSCRETVIHLLAKVILTRSKVAVFPEHTEINDGVDMLLKKFISKESVFGGKVTLIDPIEEHYLSDARFKPDVYTSFELYGDVYSVAIEIAVTHFVDDDKYLKVTGTNTNMLEVNLSKFISRNDEITEEYVERELLKLSNWTWIHKDQLWVAQVKRHSADNLRQLIESSNNNIKIWCDKLREYYAMEGKIRLPEYVYSDMVNNPRIWSDKGQPIPIDNLPDKPNIEEILDVESVGDLVDGVINLTIKFHDKQFNLPLRLTEAQPPTSQQTKTYLILNPKLNGLPEIEYLERVIYWGYNQKAIRHEERIHGLIEANQKQYDFKLKSEVYDKLHNDITLYEMYRTGEKIPVASRLKDLKEQARIYWLEMNQNGIPVNDILQDVSNDWIFGCEQIWQVYVMYAMCVDGSAHGRADDIYKLLRSKFNLYPVWPIAELHRNRKVLIEMEYEIEKLIDPVDVISQYLFKLSAVRVVMPPIGRNYEKRFRCGDSFKSWV